MFKRFIAGRNAVVNKQALLGGAVVLTSLFYLYLGVDTCVDHAPGVPDTSCEELRPFVQALCGVPPLVIAMLMFGLFHGERTYVELNNPTVDEEGKIVVDLSNRPSVPEKTIEEWARTVTTISSFSFAGSFAFGFLVILLAIPLAGMCGLGGCSDDSFVWFETSLGLVALLMKISYGCFVASVACSILAARGAFDSVNLGSPSQKSSPDVVRIDCPECGQQLRFPADFSGRVKCPACETLFRSDDAQDSAQSSTEIHS